MVKALSETAVAATTRETDGSSSKEGDGGSSKAHTHAAIAMAVKGLSETAVAETNGERFK